MAGIELADYMQDIHGRLSGQGFRWREDAAGSAHGFLGVAHKSGFKLTKMGNSEEFFVFGKFDDLDPGTLREFSGKAFAHCLKHKGCFLPRGLFNGVWVYPVAIARAVDDETAKAVRGQTPKKHWASAEVPSVLDLGSGELTTFEKTPLWGAAYWNGFRKTIRQLLSP